MPAVTRRQIVLTIMTETPQLTPRHYHPGPVRRFACESGKQTMCGSDRFAFTQSEPLAVRSARSTQRTPQATFPALEKPALTLPYRRFYCSSC